LRDEIYFKEQHLAYELVTTLVKQSMLKRNVGLNNVPNIYRQYGIYRHNIQCFIHWSTYWVSDFFLHLPH